MFDKLKGKITTIIWVAAICALSLLYLGEYRSHKEKDQLIAAELQSQLSLAYETQERRVIMSGILADLDSQEKNILKSQEKIQARLDKLNRTLLKLFRELNKIQDK